MIALISSAVPSNEPPHGERPVTEGDKMAQLIVRNLPDAIVRALKLRAAQHGRAAEAEHREILREALLPPEPERSLKEMLRAIPDVGDDADFDRISDTGRGPGL
jgi:plasmid stability protein